MVYNREIDGTTYFWKDGDVHGAPTNADGTYDPEDATNVWDYDLDYNEIAKIVGEVREVLGDPYDG